MAHNESTHLKLGHKVFIYLDTVCWAKDERLKNLYRSIYTVMFNIREKGNVVDYY